MGAKIPKETKVGDLDFIWSTRESVGRQLCMNILINTLIHWLSKGLISGCFENLNFCTQALILDYFPSEMYEENTSYIVDSEYNGIKEILHMKESLHMKKTLNTSICEVAG